MINVYIGSYTKKISEEIVGQGQGIYCFVFDDNLGQLQLQKVVQQLSPSYLTLSSDSKHLYTFEETTKENLPKAHAYKVADDGISLDHINSQKIPGGLPCHLDFFSNRLVIACYETGNFMAYPIMDDGGILPFETEIKHEGSGTNTTRQESPHAHMVCANSDNLFIVDLGIDEIKAYIVDKDSGGLVAKHSNDFQVHPGAGCRHMAFHPTLDYIFVMTELTAEIYVFQSKLKPQFVAKTNTLPDGYEDTPSGAAIRVHPNGKFIYVSNRGVNVISLLEFNEASGEVIPIYHQPTIGSTPRDFNIDPSGKWLIVANQDSHNLVVFSIDPHNGKLTKKSENNQVKSPSCVLFS